MLFLTLIARFMVLAYKWHTQKNNTIKLLYIKEFTKRIL